MRDAIDTKTIGDYTISIVPDNEPTNPRDWDNLGTMYCYHRRYSLGDIEASKQYNTDNFNNWNEFEAQLRKDDNVIVLPLGLYDHSGITMYVGSSHDRWDGGQVGFIAITREKIREEYSAKRISKQLLARVEQYLRNEVKTYDDYLTGNCYGYVIEKNGEEVDSCYGFLGDSDYAMQEGISVAQWHIEQDSKVKQAKTKAYIKNNVPLQARV